MPRRKTTAPAKPDALPVPTARLPRTRRQFEKEAESTPVFVQWDYHTARSEDGRMWAEPFASLGTQGWELVTIYPTGDAMHAPIYYAVFKREVRG